MPPRKSVPRKRTATAAKVPVKASRPVNQKHDWDRIRAAYIENVEPVTMKDLAEEFDVSLQVIKNRAHEERWSILRTEHQIEIASKASKARTKRLIAEGEAFDEQTLKAAKLGLQLVTARLAQVAELFGASQTHHRNTVQRIANGAPVTRADLYSPINYKEIGELAGALERLQTAGRRALGTDVQKIDMDVSGEIEHSGHVSVNEELQRGDMDRQAALIEAMERAGLIPKSDHLVIEGEYTEDDYEAGEEGQMEAGDEEVY